MAMPYTTLFAFVVLVWAGLAALVVTLWIGFNNRIKLIPTPKKGRLTWIKPVNLSRRW
jgi:hypothetical protein